MSFLLNPMCLILRVHAANEEVATSRISDTLQSVMKNSQEEMIEVMIWLEDIDTSQEVLSSTYDILETDKVTCFDYGLCENSETNADMYLKYISVRKETLRDCYATYTKGFAEEYLRESEIVYLSRYTPTIIAELTCDRITELSKDQHITSLDYYVDGSVDDMLNDDLAIRSIREPGEADYYTSTQIKNMLSFPSLYNLTGSQGEGAIVGVYDSGYPQLTNPLFSGVSITHHYTPNETYTMYDTHSTEVLEILCTLVPDATFFYSTYRATSAENGFIPTDKRPTLTSKFDWFIDNDVNVISTSLNLSYTNSDEYTDDINDYGSVAAYLDYVSYYYCITILTSSGNRGHHSMSSGAVAYNVITVGNFNLGENEIAFDSSYYTDTEWANKPDLCAPGNISFATTGILYSATSYATPVAASLAAMIVSYYMDMQDIFRCLPSNIKAIMCAGTTMRQYSTDSNNYKIYGAGVINCAMTASMLTNDSYVFNSIAPTISNREYTIIGEGNSDAHIVLVFEKCCEHKHDTDNRCRIANLNIELYGTSATPIRISSTTNSNVEIIRLPQGLSGNYTIRIVQVTPAYCDNVAIDTYYTLLWRCE